MATSNTRDVKMTLSVETLGADDIKKLQASVASLAKEGGDAAPEFQALADEIGRLGDQSAALQAFRQLSDETTELSAKQEAAAASVASLSQKLQEAQTVTRAASEAQRSAAQALQEAQAAARATRDELDTLVATTDKAGKAEKAYADEVQRLKLAKIEQRAEVERLRAAMTASNDAVTDAVQAETRLETAYVRATGAARAAEAAITEQQAALRASAAAAEALGVSTANVAASQAGLLSALNSAGQAAQTMQGSVERLARAEAELASLQAFEKQAADAKRLFDTSEYADLFERALERVASAEREVAAAQAALDWQREAEEIVNAAEATQRLAREQEELLAVQRQLAADNALARQADEAERLARTADQIRLFTQVLDDLERQERETAEAAEQAGAKIRDSFGAVGIKSAQSLEAQIVQVREAMDTLRTSAGLTGPGLQQAFNAGNAKIKELERDLRAVNGQLTLADRAAILFKGSLGQIAAGNVIADGVGYLVNKVKELGAAFIDVTMQTERSRKGLQAIYKDTALAAQQFQFMRDTANGAGVSISSINDAFLRFSAATKSANIPLSVTNDLFVSVTKAGATLGLSGEQVTGTLDALGQMASKGVVSMEELRQQLGDRLPGALSLAATGLGITDQQLIKLVESGSLATRDFFPAFASGLKTMAGDTNTLTGAWQRFTNVLNEGAVAIGDAGGLTLLKVAVQALSIAFGAVAVPIQGFIEAVGLSARAVGVFYARLTGDGAAAMAEFELAIERSATRVAKFQGTIDAAVSSGDKETASLKATTSAHGAAASALLQTAAAQERAGAGAAVATNAYVQQLVRLSENSVAVEAAVAASEKLFRAKQEEGKAQLLTAQLTGSASEALTAQATAAAANVLSSDQIVAARTREVSVTQQAVALVNAERDARGLLTSDRQAFLDKLTTQLQLQEAELEKARQVTFELGRQALAARTAATAYEDNSTKVGAYQSAMENARATVVLLTEQVARQTAEVDRLALGHKVGKVSLDEYSAGKANLALLTAQLNTATGEAAVNENLYRDAVADSVAASDRKARAESANLAVTEALVKVQQLHYETLARQSKALGDEAMATYYSVEAKGKQIEAIRLAVQIKNLELQADKAAIEIQISALDPQDKLYGQKKQELEIRLQIIKAKQIEAEASKEVIRGIEDEITALRNKAAQQGGSVNVVGGSNTKLGADGNPGSGSGSGSGAGGAGSGNPSRNKDGSMAGTFTNLTPLDKAMQVRDSIGRKTYGAEDVEFLQEAKKQADDAKAWLDAMAKSGGAGSISNAAWTSAQGLQVATKNALDAALAKKRSEDASAAKPTASPSSGAGSTHNVSITLPNGARGVFNMASDSDASGLTALLSQLGNAKKVS